MWNSKMGIKTFNDNLFKSLIKLMEKSEVDYTIFFR